MGEKLEKKERERNYLKTAHKSFLFPNEGPRGFYSETVTLQLLVHLIGPPVTLLTSAILAFSWFNFGCIFESLPRTGLS